VRYKSMPRSAELPSERIARDLRHRIETGEFGPGDQLPSVSDLAREHHASSATVAKALASLRAEGLIITRHGWGSFVAVRGDTPDAG
jgi:GntR family transcriptional regulator